MTERISETPDVNQAHARVDRTLFGHLSNGEPVHRFRLGRPDGPSISISEFGSALTSIRMPDRNGKIEDILLGFSELEEYVDDHDYLGVVVGRFANRIGQACFPLEGKTVKVTPNLPPHHLHGGDQGFGKHLWHGEIVPDAKFPTVVMSRLSPDGEEGYPGNLDVRVTVSFVWESLLDVTIRAVSDRATVANLTLHPYFNLSGTSGSILDHELELSFSKILETDEMSIPTGDVLSVGGTPLDFRKPVRIGERIDDDYPPLRFAGGYDQCWVRSDGWGEFRQMARVVEPTSGRVLELLSTAPGIQFYAGNALGDTARSEGRSAFARRSGFSLEPQEWPDAPNHPGFPSASLMPGQEKIYHLQYRFSVTDR